MKKFIYLIVIVLSILLSANAQNLILNPSCDDSLVGGNIPHWQEISGNDWTQRCANPNAFAGLCYFFPEAVPIGELGQVIDISSDSIEIDNGNKDYFFTGYVRAYEQSPSDESNIFIQFRNSLDTLLTTFTFGSYNQTEIWLCIDSTLLAPIGSRKINLRLHSIRYNGTNNDGYYDELYLGNTPLIVVKEINKSNTFSIYPNPTSTTITMGSTTKGQCTILSINGKQLLQQKIAEPITTVDISNLPCGVYFVKVVEEKGVQLGKFVKQ